MNETINNNKLRKKRRRLTIGLVGIVLGMFAFGYALVPIYNVLCSAFGINGKTGGRVANNAQTAIDESRTITVQFLATRNANLPWTFYPMQTSIKIHPGQNQRITYFAENKSVKTMTVQAIPSVTPGPAAKYLKKTECFCFAQQTLKSMQTMQMPLIFHLDRDIPKNIKMMTLAYTLFDVTNSAKKQRADAGRL